MHRLSAKHELLCARAADKSLEEGRGKNLNDSAHGTAPVLKDKDAEKQTTLPGGPQ